MRPPLRLPPLFRPAPARSAARNLLHTAAQSAVIWALALGVGPAVLLLLERWLGVPGLRFAGRPSAAAALFVACSLLNLGTGAVLAVRGVGTPLPLASPRALVVVGPYRHVRNPMAIAGLGQGAAVGLWLGSWVVLAYVAAGALLWQVAVRPAEERDLARRFGVAYLHYRAAVPLWWPRVRPYRARGAEPGRGASSQED